jgi:hypothetical protein
MKLSGSLSEYITKEAIITLNSPLDPSSTPALRIEIFDSELTLPIYLASKNFVKIVIIAKKKAGASSSNRFDNSVDNPKYKKNTEANTSLIGSNLLLTCSAISPVINNPTKKAATSGENDNLAEIAATTNEIPKTIRINPDVSSVFLKKL